jgi:hypothetical protein
MPQTSLRHGIEQTVAIFRELHQQGRLDTADLEAPRSGPATVALEP